MGENWALFGLSLLILALTSGLYALFLQTRVGRLLVTRRTWLTVVIGVAMVIGAVAPFIGLEHSLMVLAGFSAGGIPMVARSIFNELRDEERAKELWRGQ